MRKALEFEVEDQEENSAKKEMEETDECGMPERT